MDFDALNYSVFDFIVKTLLATKTTINKIYDESLKNHICICFLKFVRNIQLETLLSQIAKGFFCNYIFYTFLTF